MPDIFCPFCILNGEDKDFPTEWFSVYNETNWFYAIDYVSEIDLQFGILSDSSARERTFMDKLSSILELEHLEIWGSKKKYI